MFVGVAGELRLFQVLTGSQKTLDIIKLLAILVNAKNISLTDEVYLEGGGREKPSTKLTPRGPVGDLRGEINPG